MNFVRVPLGALVGRPEFDPEGAVFGTKCTNVTLCMRKIYFSNINLCGQINPLFL